ncbi:hypothetical protein [Xanthocytophaga agilis]|uniref:Uncharacterized protein n=1 Tax=Xanthocytophaga agilis TaxID=3048010 RepID=A0AAE3R3K4_9BACT|nr:hypothetical protein [Xanthocytophaga agilis]MDJ1500944.1 hypothetical protein [Xanthocytophaga agilis]
MNKYDIFFNEVKDLSIQINAASIKDFEGASEQEIVALENEIDFYFDSSLKTYLKHFGRKIRIKDFDLMLFTMQDILKAEKAAKEDTIKAKMNDKIRDVLDGKEYLTKTDKICFINLFDVNYYFTFINSKEENPILYGWDGAPESYSDRLTLTGNLRYELYISLLYKCNIRFQKADHLVKYQKYPDASPNYIHLDDLKWLDLFREKNIPVYSVHSDLRNLNDKVREIEVNENRIIGIQEYGEEFKKYIKTKIT